VSLFRAERFAGAAISVSDILFREAAEGEEELACYDGTVLGGTNARLHRIWDSAFAVVPVSLVVLWLSLEIHKMVIDLCRLGRWLYKL
jgi:hypothetical protein